MAQRPRTGEAEGFSWVKRCNLRRRPAVEDIQSYPEVSACWSGVALVAIADVLALPAGRHRADTATKTRPFRRYRHGVDLERDSPLVVRERDAALQVAFLFLAGLAVLVFANGGNDFVGSLSHSD